MPLLGGKPSPSSHLATSTGNGRQQAGLLAVVFAAVVVTLVIVTVPRFNVPQFKAGGGVVSLPPDLSAVRAAAWARLVDATQSKDQESLKPVLEAVKQLQSHRVGTGVGNCLAPPATNWVAQLRHAEARMLSPSNEDGVLLAILLATGVQNLDCAEIGEETNSKTRILRQLLGWKGVVISRRHGDKPAERIRNAYVSPRLINTQFKFFNVSQDISVLPIDNDYDDWWVWRALDPRYKPRILMIEHQSGIPPNVSVTVEPYDSRRWIGTNYFGASLLAMVQLGRQRGYTLVHVDSLGITAIFVRSDVLACQGVAAPPLEQLHRPPAYNGGKGHPPNQDSSRHWLYLDDQGNVVREGPPEWEWMQAVP